MVHTFSRDEGASDVDQMKIRSLISPPHQARSVISLWNVAVAIIINLPSAGYDKNNLKDRPVREVSGSAAEEAGASVNCSLRRAHALNSAVKNKIPGLTTSGAARITRRSVGNFSGLLADRSAAR